MSEAKSGNFMSEWFAIMASLFTPQGCPVVSTVPVCSGPEAAGMQTKAEKKERKRGREPPYIVIYPEHWRPFSDQPIDDDKEDEEDGFELAAPAPAPAAPAPHIILHDVPEDADLFIDEHGNTYLRDDFERSHKHKHH